MKSDKSLIVLISNGYQCLIRGGEYLQSFILILFRIYWGWKFFLTGKGKLLNHERTVEFFTSLGIPAADLNAWFVGGLECVGGLLLLVGLASRPVAFLLAGNMLVAYLSVSADRQALFGILSDPMAFIIADPFFFLLLSLMVLAFGPGKISIDALLKRLIMKKWPDACSCCSTKSCE